MKAVLNTTVVSNFSAIDQMDALRHLFEAAFLPTDVYTEILDGLAEGYAFYEKIQRHLYPLDDRGWLRLTSVSSEKEIEIYSRVPSKVHRGEAACIAIAASRNLVLLSDDKAARQYAESLDIRVSGTLGCLLLGVRKKLWSLEEANEDLAQLIAEGFRSPFPDLQSALRSFSTHRGT